MTYLRLAALVLMTSMALGGCSRKDAADQPSQDEGAAAPRKGNDAAIGTIRAAARALAQPQASVDYVAAEMKGVIKARTKSQALIHYDGYRATLTTPGDRVTQITFQLVEAKPTVAQLTKVFGEPQDSAKGALFLQHTEATSSTIRILAEPDAMPADEHSLVRRIIIEGERHR